jgi:AcrR family transcriptional regulator
MSAKRSLQPRRTPVQDRSAATVQAIVEAAAQVFERHGYAAGTTNRIAERAGVSIGSLYQYFPNKDAILVALIERHIEEGEDVLAPLLTELDERPPPVREALERIVQALLELHRQRPNLHRVLFEEAPRPPQLRDRLQRIFDLATVAFARYLDCRPEVTVADTRIAAELAVQSVEAITHGLVIHPRADVAAEAYAREATVMLDRYLTGPVGMRRAGTAAA